MLPLYTSARSLEFNDLLRLKACRIRTDWFHNAKDHQPRFVLALDSDNLWFYAACDSTPVYCKEHACGAFVEGLWRKDAAELFVAADQGSAYFEVNLSPGGAWWWCKFERCRKRCAGAEAKFEHKPPCFSLVDSSSWQAAIAVPRAWFENLCGFGPQTRANVSFITNTPQQLFWSWAKISSEKPDFHCTQDFEPLAPQEVQTDLPRTAA